ncbi:hypothetical protein BC936DRAFT_141356 [Jimgerdemannia flammicorona]|uniref:F-box domain-containing protein n=1 Tax=Jimgerdemannia flammicorona TaxID=994334 RepID=A0A433DGB7_9FUNG|nr:hypothetical protein BC936DRAFT_141356 [Jimgerdemannia flammicorona]
MPDSLTQRINALLISLQSSNKVKGEPTSRLPTRQLPPELVYNVFSYLPRPNNRDTTWVLDLMSCSLVCKIWQHEARTFLPPTFLHTIDLHADEHHCIDLFRLVSLLTTSNRVGLNHGTLIQTLHLDLTSLYSSTGSHYRWDRTREDALVVLFRAAQPNLTTLRLRAWPSPPGELDADFKRLFSRVCWLCKTVTRLQLRGYFVTRHKEVWFDSLAWFIASLAGTVRVVECREVKLGERMQRAVERCVKHGAYARFSELSLDWGDDGV